MNFRAYFNLFVGLCILLVGFSSSLAQPASVTMQFDQSAISVGGSTVLRVFAQIPEDQRESTDRIFSWYLDLLNEGLDVAVPRYDELDRPTSDKDSRTSSAGVTAGANRLGVHDTFINLENAGRLEPVELFSVPIDGAAVGQAIFRVRAGTGVANLSSDFIVAPAGGGDPLIGGNYAAAMATLTVAAGGGDDVVANLAVVQLPAGQGVRATIAFNPLAGRNHFVEFRDSLIGGPDWQSLPGGPHNAGSATDESTFVTRFYRVRVE